LKAIYEIVSIYFMPYVINIELIIAKSPPFGEK